LTQVNGKEKKTKQSVHSNGKVPMQTTAVLVLYYCRLYSVYMYMYMLQAYSEIRHYA